MALIPFYKPTLRRKDMDAVLQTMVDERIGPGEKKNEFLKQFCAYIGSQGGFALRTYLDALTIGLRMLSLPANAKIGVSLLSPKIYEVAASQLGYELVLGDIDKDHGCLSYEEALRLTSCGCSALLLYEPMCQIPYQSDYSACGIPIIEDISQSLGSVYDEQRAGSYGDLVVCSFEEDGVVSCGGGAVLAYRKGSFASHVSAMKPSIPPCIELPDMNAALGTIQLANLDEHLEKRREFHTLFCKSLLKTQHRLYGIGNIDFQPNGYGFCVVLDSKAEEAIKFSMKYQVSAKRTFADALAQNVADRFDLYPNGLPAYLRAISLPIYPFLKQSDVELLMKVISHLP